jgi:ubiquinone biosynthesis protein
MSSSSSLSSRFRSAKRLTQVIQVFAHHGFWSLVERSKLQKSLTKTEQKEIEQAAQTDGENEVKQYSAAARLRIAFEELGPAFVKLGQILASRDDLVPAHIIEELSKLHSSVAPMPFSDVMKILEEEVDKKALASIVSIDEKPLAAGSIGQVHLAHLSDGQTIVLKVQRPGILKVIKGDLELMGQVAHDLEKYLPELRPYRPAVLISELNLALLGELDYLREAANTEKIRKNFENDDDIVLPKVIWSYTTSKVLGLEFLRGEKMPSSPHPNADIIIAKGLEMFLKMVALDGEYHGDLHPGNLLLLPGARLGVIDFGLTVRLSGFQRLLISEIFVSLIEGDCDRLARAMVEMGDPSSDFDYDGYNSELLNTIGPYMGGSISSVKTGKLLFDFSKVSAKHGVPLPRSLFLVLKTLASFESVGRRLDPNFDVMRLCEQHVHVLKLQINQTKEVKTQLESIAKDLASLVRIAPFQIRKLLKSAVAGDLKLNISNDSTLELAVQISKASSRIAISVILTGTILASSMLVSISDQWKHLGIAGYILSGVLGLFVVFSIILNRP